MSTKQSDGESGYKYTITVTITVVTLLAIGLVFYYENMANSDNYVIPAILVILTWGLVPTLAKQGNMPGDLTTFWVNLFAAPAVALLITAQVNTSWSMFSSFKAGDYLTLTGIGLIWPLLYSITYFQSVKESGGTWTVILNYLWPIFALAWAFLLSNKQPNVGSVITVAVAVLAVFIARRNTENTKRERNLTLLGLALGITAAVTQGFSSAAPDKWKYDAWAMTLVVEVVTVIGITIFVLLRKSFKVPSFTTMLSMCFVGAISNGIGFWAFLEGNQASARLGTVDTCYWLAALCSIPVVQAIALAKLGKEKVKKKHWFAVILLAANLMIHKLIHTF